jgi:YegS/Rv2252/BmrU family lipid kinase
MPSSSRNVLVIYNPAAQGGASAGVYNAYLDFLGTNHIRCKPYITTGDGQELVISKLIQEYKFTAITIIGGDGTINLAINSLPHLELPIHLIPAGSGNDLAKMIYPKSTPSQEQLFALVLNKNPETMTLDIWRCNDQLFANGFGCGFDGSIAYNAKYKKGIWGSKMKYWVEIVKHIFLYRSPIFSVDGKEYTTFMLSVANGKVYGGDFMVAPHADTSDGYLEVVRIHKLSVLKRLLNLPLMKKGGHLKKDFVSYERKLAVHIKSDIPLAAHLDGEPVSEKDYRISKAGEMRVLQ